MPSSGAIENPEIEGEILIRLQNTEVKERLLPKLVKVLSFIFPLCSERTEPTRPPTQCHIRQTISGLVRRFAIALQFRLIV